MSGAAPGADGRSVAIELTERGREAAARVAGSRAEVLDGALAVLSPGERQTFDRLAGKVLAGLIRGPGATRWMCRLCDTGVCRGAEGGCPVGNAARAPLRARAAGPHLARRGSSSAEAVTPSTVAPTSTIASRPRWAGVPMSSPRSASTS